MTALVLALVGAGLVLAVMAWIPRSGSIVQVVISGVMLACLAAAGVLLIVGDGVTGWREAWWNVLLLTGGSLAVAGGGPLTTSVLALVDRGNTRTAQSTQKAGEVLRGGALIGSLERGAIYGALVAGWPEGLAIILAIKGLARYPELRSPDQPASVTPQAVAERFIIGTFTSVLWSVVCGGLLLSR